MMTSRRRRSAALTLAAAVAGAAVLFVASLRRAEDTRDGIYLASSSEQMPEGPFCCMMPKFGNDDYASGPDECACAPVFAVTNETGPYNYCAQSAENCADCGYSWCPGRKHVQDIAPTTNGDDVSLVGGGGGGGGGGGDLEYHGPLPKVKKLPIVKLPPLAITSTVTTGGSAPAAPESEPIVTVALPTPVVPEGPPASVAEPTPEQPVPASEITAAPTPGTTLVQITEETDERRRLSVFSASARRKRAAGHLRQVEKRHAHAPHPGVTGQLEYDHPVSYEVAVAKKPQMILNSEEMEQMYETNPKEAAKYVFVSNMPGEAP